MTELKKGDRVRMTAALKAKMRGNCLPGKHVDPQGVRQTDDECLYCSTDHIEEFGECVGVVDGLVDWNVVPPSDPLYVEPGPEVDVRWQPSNLRYAYDPNDLQLA